MAKNLKTRSGTEKENRMCQREGQEVRHSVEGEEMGKGDQRNSRDRNPEEKMNKYQRTLRVKV